MMISQKHKYWFECTLFFAFSILSTGASAANKTAKKHVNASQEQRPAEMHVDPGIINEYQRKTAFEAAKLEQADVAFVGVEPAIDIYDLQALHAKSDYFTVPVESSGRTLVAPRVWVGTPLGWDLTNDMRLRAGVDFSYLNRDGAQSVHQEALDMDVRDNIAIHIFPIIPSLTWSYVARQNAVAVGPWASIGVGSALTQVSGTLDGISQSGWTPVTRIAAGISLGDTAKPSSSYLPSVRIGVFSVAGSSSRLEWRSRGLLVGANFVL